MTQKCTSELELDCEEAVRLKLMHEDSMCPHCRIARKRRKKNEKAAKRRIRKAQANSLN